MKLGLVRQYGCDIWARCKYRWAEDANELADRDDCIYCTEHEVVEILNNKFNTFGYGNVVVTLRGGVSIAKAPILTEDDLHKIVKTGDREYFPTGKEKYLVTRSFEGLVYEFGQRWLTDNVYFSKYRAYATWVRYNTNMVRRFKRQHEYEQKINKLDEKVSDLRSKYNKMAGQELRFRSDLREFIDEAVKHYARVATSKLLKVDVIDAPKYTLVNYICFPKDESTIRTLRKFVLKYGMFLRLGELSNEFVKWLRSKKTLVDYHFSHNGKDIQRRVVWRKISAEEYRAKRFMLWAYCNRETIDKKYHEIKGE